jgi:hypothetical protein
MVPVPVCPEPGIKYYRQPDQKHDEINILFFVSLENLSATGILHLDMCE